ncbi:MAG: hypothetical protein LBP59_06505, partial [Planctomycetaceae bacterium]|nr:hypothetical protein [Planctomycetaceae bacterium]
TPAIRWSRLHSRIAGGMSAIRWSVIRFKSDLDFYTNHTNHSSDKLQTRRPIILNDVLLPIKNFLCVLAVNKNKFAVLEVFYCAADFVPFEEALISSFSFKGLAATL